MSQHTYMYQNVRWRKLRLAQLAKQPLCEYCQDAGRITAANTCDHVEPHRGDVVKFWKGPFRSLCSTCHSAVKQREENTGVRPGCDESGYPIGW